MTIHSKTFIHLFSFALFAIGISIGYYFQTQAFLLGMSAIILCMMSVAMFIANGPAGELHDLINTAKSHTARILKNGSGIYVLEICQFPLIYSQGFDSVNEAECQYEFILNGDKKAATTRKEAGLVKVLASPKKSEKPKSSIQDDIEHIKQVARESGVNMDAFNKIEEILSKTYKDEQPAKVAPVEPWGELPKKVAKKPRQKAKAR